MKQPRPNSDRCKQQPAAGAHAARGQMYTLPWSFLAADGGGGPVNESSNDGGRSCMLCMRICCGASAREAGHLSKGFGLRCCCCCGIISCASCRPPRMVGSIVCQLANNAGMSRPKLHIQRNHAHLHTLGPGAATDCQALNRQGSCHEGQWPSPWPHAARHRQTPCALPAQPEQGRADWHAAPRSCPLRSSPATGARTILGISARPPPWLRAA